MRTPDTTPERLSDIRAQHERYRTQAHYEESFNAVEDLLAMLREQGEDEGYLCRENDRLRAICAALQDGDGRRGT